MSEGFPPAETEPGMNEQYPPDALISYFQGQFSDAYIKQSLEETREAKSQNGEFVRSVPIESGHNLTRGSHRILLKPPHPSDTSGVYCEVYAVLINRLASEEPGAQAEAFVIRDFTHNRPGPFWLADHSGVISIEVEDQFIAASDDPLYSADASPVDRARSMLNKYSKYNIVASSD